MQLLRWIRVLNMLRVYPAADQELQDRRIFKLLLLGLGDVGKSTLVRQMQNIYGEFDDRFLPSQVGLTGFAAVVTSKIGFSSDTKRQYREHIRRNVLQIVRTLLTLYQSEQQPAGNSQRKSTLAEVCQLSLFKEKDFKLLAFVHKLIEDYDAIISSSDDTERLLMSEWTQISKLWLSNEIQAVYRRHEFSIHGWAEFFLNNVQRIAALDYWPTRDDILRVRVPTRGAQDFNFIVHRVKLTMKDFGGQVNERMQWVNYIQQSEKWVKESITDRTLSVIFVASLADYDHLPEVYSEESHGDSPPNSAPPKTPGYSPTATTQLALKDQRTSVFFGLNTKLDESICLFQVLVNMQELRDHQFLLFLNKEDIFREKFYRLQNFHNFFAEFNRAWYNQPQAYEKAKEFIVKRFVSTLPSMVGVQGDPNGGTSSSGYRGPSLVVKHTCATDTQVMSTIFAATYDHLLNDVLRSPQLI